MLPQAQMLPRLSRPAQGLIGDVGSGVPDSGGALPGVRCGSAAMTAAEEVDQPLGRRVFGRLAIETGHLVVYGLAQILA